MTVEEEVIQGEFLVNFKQNVIIYDAENKRRFFLPSKIKSFRYFDEEANINRKFITIQENRKYEFYEIVSEGEIVVVRKKMPIYKILPEKRYIYDRYNYPEEAQNYRYFILNDCNELMEFSQFQRKILPKLDKEWNKQLTAFCKQENLLIRDNEIDMIRLIIYFNDLIRIDESDYAVRN